MLDALKYWSTVVPSTRVTACVLEAHQRVKHDDYVAGVASPAALARQYTRMVDSLDESAVVRTN
jgi:hypothetical protein